MGFSVVVLESDPRLAQSLAGGLSSHFNSIQLTRSGDELRERIARNRPEVVILDMEYSRLTDVRNLHHDFPSLPIVCTHRVPDENCGSPRWKQAPVTYAPPMTYPRS